MVILPDKYALVRTFYDIKYDFRADSDKKGLAFQASSGKTLNLMGRGAVWLARPQGQVGE
jgi:hypothetical protein